MSQTTGGPRIIRASEIGRSALGEERRTRYDAGRARLVITEIPDGHVQNAHLHRRLYDITLVLEGSVEVIEACHDAGVGWVPLGKGDLVVFMPGRAHNVRNTSGGPAVMLTVKVADPLDLDDDAFAGLLDGDWHAARVDA